MPDLKRGGKKKRERKVPVSPRAGRATRSLDPPDCQILQSEAPADLYNRLEGPYVTCRDLIWFRVMTPGGSPFDRIHLQIVGKANPSGVKVLSQHWSSRNGVLPVRLS